MLRSLLLLGSVAATADAGLRRRATVRRPAPARPRPDRAQPVVLVVDDAAAVRGSTARILARSGYTVLQAGSAEEAVATWRAQAGGIDVLLSDVVMPGASGFELAATIRGLDPRAAVVLVSGFTPGALERHDLVPGDGRLQVIQKPLERSALLAGLRNAREAA